MDNLTPVKFCHLLDKLNYIIKIKKIYFLVANFKNLN